MRDVSLLDNIEEGIEAIKNGEVVIVVDDEDRENEGDFICAAETITTEIVNFMAMHGRGLICVPLIEERCYELDLELMVGKNTAIHGTPFTVSVDLIDKKVSTGISAEDRYHTIKALVDENTKPEDLGRPGHIFPLKAKKGGVLRRTGHTEATIDLARLAGFRPAGVLVEIMNENGSMARLPHLRKIADQFKLKLISIDDLIDYRLKKESLIERITDVNMPTEYGSFQLKAYRQTNTGEVHLALVKGTWRKDDPVLVRVHSSCVTGDIFGSCRCDCGPQLHGAMEKGFDTVEANEKLVFKADERDYGVGAQILRDLNISKINLISNNPKKRVGLMGYGLEIVEVKPIEIIPNQYNLRYLKTKRDKMGHNILNDEK
jgi:3,4-dihydroxy 2-butanone 4-phosphate synthase/GTP cyclohydrolase II